MLSGIYSFPVPCVLEDYNCSVRTVVSGGVNYVDGDVVVRGGSALARASFFVDSFGTIRSIELLEGGSGFTRDPNPEDFDILFHNSTVSQTGTVTGVVVDAAGVNFVSGYITIVGGSDPALGSMNLDKFGRIISVSIVDHGSGFANTEFSRGFLTQSASPNATVSVRS